MTASSSHPFEESPDAIARRLMQKAHNRDGLPEIAIGFFFLLVATLIYVQTHLRYGSIAFNGVVLAQSFVIPLLCIFMPRVLRWVRCRYLMERVGYVQPKSITRKQIGIGILLAVVASAVSFGVVLWLPSPDSWVLAGSGVLGGALVAFCGRNLRFAIGGVLSAVAGILIGFSGVSLDTGFAILFGFLGLLSLISGSVVLLRFIRQPLETGD